MNDPRRPERFSPLQAGSEPTGPIGPRNAPLADPAYADQAPYAPTYGGYAPQWAPSLNETNPTKRLPAYWQQDQDQPPPGGLPPGGMAPPPPEGPRSPRWLLIGAGAAVLLVVALLIALVLTNGALKTQTAVPPLPAMPGSSAQSPTPTPSTRAARPSQTLVPAPPPSGSAGPAPTPGAIQNVVYNVSGEGRAISITYWDTGDVIQTEFNVSLPWTKQVSLSQSAAHPASVTIINIGHNVTCSVSVDGVQVRQRLGAGITVCDAAGR
ncbi:MmpS family transport accessory protein [Mycobacterium sp. Aquia_213]|uniref:MmpS family transport accessory protein n=1 Tax=Mycobacterium sp. Aquia_213 TaxID=2991728 RepID=UPI00226E40C6|nr:MmpS family transport accessory protein [Mycobacterium sp. Aquia_213]WAC93136.1 MmpS family transport accessory protein [Mycobacterium sp. Aquia_213]